MAVRSACMHRALAKFLPAADLSSSSTGWAHCFKVAPVRLFSAVSQPTGRTGSGSATNVSGQREQEAAAEEGAPPPDSAFDAGGAAGKAMGGADHKKEGEGKSGHTQNFDQEAGREGGKAATGKGAKQFSTRAGVHAFSSRGFASLQFYQSFSSGVETPNIDAEKAMSDKDFLRSSPGGAALEDKQPEEGNSSGSGQGERKPIGRQTGTGSATNPVSGGAGNVPPGSSFDAGGSQHMGEGESAGRKEHSQNFDDEMKTKGGSKESVK